MALIELTVLSQGKDNNKKILIRDEDICRVFEIEIYKSSTPLIGEKPTLGTHIWTTPIGQTAINVRETVEEIKAFVNNK